MRVEAYRAEHLAQLELQEGQGYLGCYLDGALRKSLEGEFSYTLLTHDRVLACCGLMELWQNRAICWAYLDGGIGASRFLVLHKMVKRFMDIAPYDRIEATVDVEFEAGHRWVRALGFEVEAPLMRKHRPDGGDSVGYVRIR